MYKYRINYKWKENNNNAAQNIRHNFEFGRVAKTPTQAAKQFYEEWTNPNGYMITSIMRTSTESNDFVEQTIFHPKKFAKKNW